MITILTSTEDIASTNIKQHLMEMRSWSTLEESEHWRIYGSEQFRLVNIDELMVHQDNIDTQLEDAGYTSELIVFASRHRSKDPRPILTAHFTGNVGKAMLGGKDNQLITPAPWALKSLMLSLEKRSSSIGFEVALECTHHGPTDIDTPSVYVEIGSSEEEWRNTDAGRIIAESILELRKTDPPIAIGFGGSHYAPRQTNLILGSDITFGHIFPDHVLDSLDLDLLEQAFTKSKADFAYFDRKAMSSAQRERLSDMITSLGYWVLRETEITTMAGIPWKTYHSIRSTMESSGSDHRLVVTPAMRTRIMEAEQPKIVKNQLDAELLQEAIGTDRERTEHMLNRQPVAYAIREDGTHTALILTLREDSPHVPEKLTEECIKILERSYSIEYNRDTQQLILKQEKFSPKLARKHGVPQGPLYGELASGKPININGRTINPNMVHETISKAIKINNFTYILEKEKRKVMGEST